MLLLPLVLLVVVTSLRLFFLLAVFSAMVLALVS